MASTSKFDISKLAQRLRGLDEELWLHLESASRLEKYPAKQHARRVRENLGVSVGLIYLPGQLLQNKEDSDMPVPFRQRRYFYYLSGCNEPNCHVTYDIQHDRLALFIPRIDPVRVIWNGRGSTPAEALDKYDIDEVYFADQLPAWIQTWSAHYQGRLYILHDIQAPPIHFFKGAIDSESLQPAVDLARVIKDDHEIGLIRKANKISSEAHRQVLANIQEFTNEAQVEGLFIDVCISNQAKEQAYAPIAASGPNAGTLHYDSNNEDFGNRQLICLDAGCEYELYASDITRSFPLSGSWPSVEAENTYKLVERMQEVCIKRLAPGVRYLDLHILAHHIAIDGLLKLGVLHNGTIEEIYKAGTSRAFFPHGLGHHVGLEVHDVGYKELTSLSGKIPTNEKVASLYPENFHLPVYDEKLCLSPTDPQSTHLREGMVVTVEPGIYFSAYALSYFYFPSPVHSKYINKEVLSRYMPVGGVRIEDDILITSRGHENLTTAPKGQEMLEIIRTRNANRPFLQGAVSVEKTRTSSQEDEEAEGPLLPAPGISQSTSEENIKSLRRAATAPVGRRKNQRSVDFEPFEGPSLFSGFRRSATMNSPQGVLGTHTASTDRRKPLPICGIPSSEVSHLYMTWESGFGTESNVPRTSRGITKSQCRNCAVLMQSVERLRQLQAATVRKTQPVQGVKSEIEPAASRQGPGLAQKRPTSEELFRHPLANSLPPHGLPCETVKLRKESNPATRDKDVQCRAEVKVPVQASQQPHSTASLQYRENPQESTQKLRNINAQPKPSHSEAPGQGMAEAYEPKNRDNARPLQEHNPRNFSTAPPPHSLARQTVSFPTPSAASPAKSSDFKPQQEVLQQVKVAVERVSRQKRSSHVLRASEAGADSASKPTTLPSQSRKPTINQEMADLRSTMEQLMRKMERLQADYSEN